MITRFCIGTLIITFLQLKLSLAQSKVDSLCEYYNDYSNVEKICIYPNLFSYSTRYVQEHAQDFSETRMVIVKITEYGENKGCEIELSLIPQNEVLSQRLYRHLINLNPIIRVEFKSDDYSYDRYPQICGFRFGIEHIEE